MKRLCVSAIMVFVFTLVWAFFSGANAAECGNEVSHFILPGDISSVLFVVTGNLEPDEEKKLDIPSIKRDIQSMLQNAGIQPEIIEDQEAVTGDRFLKIHIYSILLERRVCFCSVAVIQHRPQQEEDCTVREYSDVTSQIGTIRSQVRALMTDLLKDVH